MNKTLIVAALLAASPFAAQAEKLSYSFIEGGYAITDHDDPSIIDRGVAVNDLKLSGLYLQGSVELGEAMYLTGGIRRGSDEVMFRASRVEFGRADMDWSQVKLGVGAHNPLSDSLDMFGDFSYIGTDFDGGVGQDKGVDYRIGVGLRSQFAPAFEGHVRANYTDGDFYDSEFSAAVGAQWKFNRVWGVTAEAELGSDLSAYTVGLRASF